MYQHKKPLLQFIHYFAMVLIGFFSYWVLSQIHREVEKKKNQNTAYEFQRPLQWITVPLEGKKRLLQDREMEELQGEG